MTRVVTSLSALLFSIILLVSGNAFLMTLLGLRLSLEKVEPALIGWILVCYSIGFVVGTLYANRVIERVGHIRSFAVFSALTAAAALIYPLSSWPPLWAVLRAVSGVSIAGLLVVIESWFSSRATNDNRGTLFAIYQIVFYLAAASGQLLVNVGDPATFEPFTLAAVLLTLALIPLSLTRMEAPVIEQVERLSFVAMFRESSTGIVGAMISGVLISAFYAMGPVYGNLIGLTLHQVSIFMASAILAAMLFAWPLGRICDKSDRRWVLFWISVLSGICSLAAALVGPGSLPLLFLLVGCFLGLASTIYPVAVAITNDRMDSTKIVSASASLLLSYGIGSCIGPIVGSALVGSIGPAGLFIGNAGVLALLALLTLYRIRHTPQVPVAAQEDFVNTFPETTPVIAEMDPRNDEFVESPEAEDIREAS
ncbi:MFS transporter [Mangrovitalea sediminis]|uniref:MFS transporter n=1 Tax=Mangrovitalea sediminis TaxID=1982043 RepID=UPI000BE5E884|nr:MFS transporter [Mangrovitalea sediminis]